MEATAGEYRYNVKITNVCGEITSNVAKATITDAATNPGGSTKVEETIPGMTISEATPNPSASEANITMTSDKQREVSVSIYDASGREVTNVFNGSFSGVKALKLNVNELPSGAYILSVSSEGKVATKRIIVSK
jgi:hypothetical protein